MSFQAPLFLLALALLPLAGWAYVRRERSAPYGRAAFAPAALLPSVAPDRPGWRLHAPAVGYALALALLIVAVSRPQATLATGVEQTMVIVLTDRSGSMLAQDVAPSRLSAAKAAARRFVNALPDDMRVGAIAFNHSVQVLNSPTRDHAEVSDAISRVDAAGSTATGDALEIALKTIAGSTPPGAKRPPAAIVLLSDGASVSGADPLVIADRARGAGVRIYTVALGTRRGTIERESPSGDIRTVPVPPDRETLRRIALRSGGEAFVTADARVLDRVYERLGSQVARERRPREVTNLFAGGALMLMAGAAAASLKWFGRLV